MMYEPVNHDDAEADPYAYSQFEQTQQASQSQSAPEPWDDTLWGVLKPMHSALSRIYLKKDKSTLTIGRSSENKVKLAHLKISNRHCVLTWDSTGKDPSVIVTDLSSNGTWVDGSKIGKFKSALMKHNQDIAFGQLSDVNAPDNFRYFFHFMGDGPPTEGVHKYYDIGHELGRGSFATVHRAVCRADGHIYAIKMINRHKLRAENEGALNVFLKEVSILNMLHHPNICQLKETFHAEDSVSLVLEYIDGGDLLDYIIARDGVTEDEARRFAFQLCKALKYIHAKGIAHRDLKPENILLTRDNPPNLKIADFGLAKAVDSMTRFKTMCGTPIYLAPEVILRNADESYSHLVDSWSTGVIIFAMMANGNPFVDDDASVIAIRFRSRYIDWSIIESKGISVECRRFLERFLEENPAERMTCADALRHPWLADMAAHEPEALDEMPNDSFVSVTANAGSFMDATMPPPPVPGTSQPDAPHGPAELPSSGISTNFQQISVDDATVSPVSATTTTAPESEPTPELTPTEPRPVASSSNRGQARKLERQAMQIAEYDDDGNLKSFHAFPDPPIGPGPIYVENHTHGNGHSLKRKERSDALMEQSAEVIVGVNGQSGGAEDEDGAVGPSLTPVSEEGHASAEVSSTSRKRSATAISQQAEESDMREEAPAKRTRAMPADVAA